MLLDYGSQANFISRDLLNTLGIQPQSSNVSISGINNTVASCSQVARVRLQSRTGTFSSVLTCIVTDQVTDKLPAFTMKRSTFQISSNLQLADPRFNVSANVDILIGAELFWQVLCIGQVKVSPSHPTLQKTRFGWILAGRLNQSPSVVTRHVQSFHASITNAQLNEQLSRFWLLEAIEGSSNLTANEAFCEQHFLSNTSRTSQGMYVVKLPFRKEIIDKIGNTKEIALRCYGGIEKRLICDPSLQIQYTRFLDEYLALGYMKPLTQVKTRPPRGWLP